MFVTSLFLWYYIIVNWVIFQVGRQILMQYTKIQWIEISNTARKYNTAVSQNAGITITVITCSESNPRDFLLNCYQPEIKGQTLVFCFICLSQIYWLWPRDVQFSKQILGIKVKHWCLLYSSRKQYSRAVSSGQRFQVPEWATNFATVCLNKQQKNKRVTSSSTYQKSGTSACELPPGSDSWAFCPPALHGNHLRESLSLGPVRTYLRSYLVLLQTIQLVEEAPSFHGSKRKHMKKKN